MSSDPHIQRGSVPPERPHELFPAAAWVALVTVVWVILTHADTIVRAFHLRGTIVTGGGGGLLVAALVHIAAGFGIGRWWVLCLAGIPALFLAASGPDADGAPAIAFAPVYVIPAAVLLTAGVLLRKRREASRRASAVGPRA